MINVMIANDRYYLMGRDGFGMIFHGVYYTLDQAQGMMFATSTGIVELQQEGALRVYDKHDRYLLGRRASGLNRADVSSESRFVVALTTTGDVLEWELGAIRPHTLAVSTSKIVEEGCIRELVASHDRDRITAVDGSKNLAWDGGSTVARIDAAQTPSVVDLATGLGYTLPTVAEHLVVHGDAVLLGSTTEVSVWKVDVPRDPVALQAWLATVTNARTVEGSEAYTWP